MKQSDEQDQDEINTLEWYEFIGHLADALPGLHLGGATATKDLLEMCQIDGNSRVLDVGCGPGNTACEIAIAWGSQVTGIDISKNMITKAKNRAHKKRLLGRVEFHVADAFQLPFDDESFDVVIIESVLNTLPGDKMVALKEMIRVTRSRGVIGANETVFYSSAPPKLLELSAEHPAIHGFLTPDSLRDLFEESGLEVIHLVGVKGKEAPSVTREMGFLGIASFLIRSYWKILGKLLTDSRFRRAWKIDDEIAKIVKEHGGYVLIVGRKS